MTAAIVFSCFIVALLLVSWFWRPRQRQERGVLALLLGYAVLGMWTLWFVWYAAPGTEPETVVHLKPTILFWMMAIVVLGSPLIGWGYPFKVILGSFFAFSPSVWRWSNFAAGLAFAILGTANLLVSHNLSEGNWVDFKYSCRVLLMFIIIFRLNFVWLDIVSQTVIYFYGRAKRFFT
jgi:intracellular septation protein A